MPRRTILEYGTYKGYHFFLFYNYATLDLRELIQNSSGIIDNKHLLVTGIGSDKIDKRNYSTFVSKGLICDYVERNFIIRPENAMNFIDILFSKDPAGSTIYFLNNMPHTEDLSNKKIYGIPVLPVSSKIFRRQRIDQQLLNILLKEIESINAHFYYDNNCSEAICVMRNDDLFENLKTALYQKHDMIEVIFEE
jgi:hypothetical protein